MRIKNNMKINHIKRIIIFGFLVFLTSCGIYTFSGTSIQPDVKTIDIGYFEYKALKVNPTFSNQMTESLKERFRKMTRLDQVDMDGDLEITGAVTDYDIRATSITANEQAAKNRLTVTLKITFKNKKHTEENFDRNFSAYSEYDSTQPLDAVEGTLCEEIIDKLVEDIFNATVANW